MKTLIFTTLILTFSLVAGRGDLGRGDLLQAGRSDYGRGDLLALS